MNRDIQIRVARESDTAALRDIYAPYVERTAVSFEYEAPDVATFLERIRRVQEKYPYLGPNPTESCGLGLCGQLPQP